MIRGVINVLIIIITGCGLHAPAACPKSKNLVVYRVEVRTYRAGAMKSGVRVNSCMVSH